MAQSPRPVDSLREETANILLVDDRPANLLSLRAILEDLGHGLVEARSGAEALEQLRDRDFAVVLLDVLMPGMSGFEAARRIRNNDRSRHTPIIFLTAHDIDRAQLEEGYTLGAVDFLTKPLLPIVLQAKVREFVELFQEKQRARREAEQLRLLVERTPGYAVFMLDPQGHVVTWNAGAERLKGYKTREIAGQHFSRFYPADAIAKGWPQHELEAARTVGHFEDEGWRIRKDGSRFWANVILTALRDEQGNLRGFSKVTRDMTERKEAEENARRLMEEATARRVAEEEARLIQEQRERLRVTLASIGDAVISTDAEGRVDFLNPVAEKLVGWKSAEAAGRALSDVFHIVNEDTRQPVENPARRALRDGVIVGLANHTVLISKDGTERPIDDSAAPIRDADGNAIGSVLVFRDVSEQRRTEQAIRRSEAEAREQEKRTSTILESITDAFCALDRDWRFVYVNRRAEALMGRKREELLGKNHWQEYPDTRGTDIERNFRRAAAENATVTFEIFYPLHDRWYENHVYPSPQGLSIYFQDVSERKHAEIALRHSEERFRQLADAMPQIVWTTRPDGAIDYLNRRWTEYTGLPQTVSNDAWRQILHPDEVRPADERWAISLDSGAAFEMEMRLLDRRRQTYRWHLIRTVAVRDEAGRIVRWFGSSTDIDQQKRAEESARFLAQTSAALASVVDYESTLQKIASLAVPYFADWSAVDMVNDDGSLRRLAVAHQDADKIALVHQLARDYPPDSQGSLGVFAVLRTGRPEIMSEIPDELLVRGTKDEEHLRLIRSLGLKSYICVSLNVSGKTLGVLTFVTAESGRRFTEADLALATDLANRAAIAIENSQLYQALRQADRRKDEFLATLAHELRNPLAPIRNSVQVMRLAAGNGEVAEQARQTIERQLTQMIRLVDDLLDISRISRNKIELRKERVALSSIVQSAVETSRPLIEASGHELRVTLPPQTVWLNADLTRMAQVLANLLNNAAKYTPEGGRIWLTAERQANDVLICLRDSGIGIPREKLPHIFELFMQVDTSRERAQGGLGIGLTLVKSLAEMHGGSIRASSAGPGQGSEFTLRLPVASGEQTARRTDKAEEGPSKTLPARRILVVDDNQDAAESLGMLLRMMGNEVRVVHDGRDALEVVRVFRPDLALLDIGMPRMSGYELARWMREQPELRRAVLVAVTGWGQEEDRRRTQEAGFDHHLTKPADLAALEKLLAELQADMG